MTTDQEKIYPVLPYVQIFATCYGVVLLAMIALLHAINLPPNLGLAIGALIGAATFTAQRFHATTGRIANPTEQLRLIIGSLVMALVFSAALLLILAVSRGMTTEEFLTVVQSLVGSGTALEWASLIAVIVGFTTAALWVSYGPLARIMAGMSRN